MDRAHDPMCPSLALPDHLKPTLMDYARCQCDLIARVRADVQEWLTGYVLTRMGHCDDCDRTQEWEAVTTGGLYPYIGPDPESIRCTCAYDTVEGLFKEARDGRP